MRRKCQSTELTDATRFNRFVAAYLILKQTPRKAKAELLADRLQEEPHLEWWFRNAINPFTDWRLTLEDIEEATPVKGVISDPLPILRRASLGAESRVLASEKLAWIMRNRLSEDHWEALSKVIQKNLRPAVSAQVVRLAFRMAKLEPVPEWRVPRIVAPPEHLVGQDIIRTPVPRGERVWVLCQKGREPHAYKDGAGLNDESLRDVTCDIDLPEDVVLECWWTKRHLLIALDVLKLKSFYKGRQSTPFYKRLKRLRSYGQQPYKIASWTDVPVESKRYLMRSGSAGYDYKQDQYGEF